MRKKVRNEWLEIAKESERRKWENKVRKEKDEKSEKKVKKESWERKWEIKWRKVRKQCEKGNWE